MRELEDQLEEAGDRIAHVKHLTAEALLTDGSHHKQWFLLRILGACGVDAAAFERAHDAEPGIPP